MAQPLSRRSLLGAAAAAAVTPALTSHAQNQPDLEAIEPAATRQRIRQSMVYWCYRPAWPDVEQMAQVASRLGIQSIELIGPEHWPTLKKHGLTCAISGSHGFRRGFNNPEKWDECIEILRQRIDACAEFGVKRVITFTGMADGIPDDVGLENCVAGYKKIIGHAERKGVTLCLEMLNTRDDSHPMKGHPGYQGDDVEYCIEICKRVGSPNMKLLFDIYHVQIMHGDVIRRIRQHADYIGHIHTAGNPGRGELDETQEINYPPIMRALLEIGYDGYVGQEYIPTREPLAGLSQAVRLCDV